MKKIILLIIILLLSSCYDYQELNDINIISSIGIDYKDNNYEVSLEIVNSEKDGSSTKISTEIVKGTSDNIANAFNKAISASDKEVYMEHLKLLILSDSVAKEGIDNIIDFTIRDIHLTNNFSIVLTNDIEELLNLKVDNDTVSSKIVDMMETMSNKKKIEDIDFIASHLLSQKQDIAFPLVEIVDNDIKIQQIGYFSYDTLIDYLDNKIYNFIILDNNKTNFTSDSNVISIYKKKIKYDITKNNITININGYGEAKEINNKYDLKNKNDYLNIQNTINKQIEEEINDFINNTYNNNSDLLGFKNMYYKKYKTTKDNINIKIIADIKLNKNGTIYEVLHD